MPFCKKCGQEVPANVAFCTSCGAPMNQDQSQAPGPVQTNQQPIAQYQPAAPPAARNNKKIMIIAVAAIAVVVVLIAAVYMTGIAGEKVYPKDVKDMLIGDDEIKGWSGKIDTSSHSYGSPFDDYDFEAASMEFEKDDDDSAYVGVTLLKLETVDDAKSMFKDVKAELEKEAEDDEGVEIKSAKYGSQGIWGENEDSKIVVFQKGNVVVLISSSGVSDSVLKSFAEAQEKAVS